MQILITGVTGRIGANLAAKLLEQGHRVRGLVWPKDPRVEKLRDLDLDLQQGSLTEADDVRRVMQDVEAVYHLGAAFQGGGPFSESDYFEINVRGTFSALGKPGAAGETFQLAGPEAFTWDDAVPYLSRKLDIPFIEAELRGPPTFYEFDLSKPREILGFHPQYDIRRMIDDALSHRRGENIGVLPTD